nr:MAG TPA: hypothetical protein [Caudoviricetes sp.]
MPSGECASFSGVAEDWRVLERKGGGVRGN